MVVVEWADNDLALEHEALSDDNAEVDLDEPNEVVGDSLLLLVELIVGWGESFGGQLS